MRMGPPFYVVLVLSLCTCSTATGTSAVILICDVHEYQFRVEAFHISIDSCNNAPNYRSIPSFASMVMCL